MLQYLRLATLFLILCCLITTSTTHASALWDAILQQLTTQIEKKGAAYAQHITDALDQLPQDQLSPEQQLLIIELQDGIQTYIHTTQTTNNKNIAPLSLPVYVQESSKAIALTFDDGPHPINTPRLLDILASKWVKATFYVNGWKVKKYPDIARRIVEEWHEIGNHSRDHPLFTDIDNASIQRQVYNTNKVIYDTTGVRPTTIRTPYGWHNTRVRNAIDMPIIDRTMDTRDRKTRDAHKVYTYITNNAYDGAIVLMHDTHATTVDAMNDTIATLMEQWYELQTVSTLLWFDNGVRPVSGHAYKDKWK